MKNLDQKTLGKIRNLRDAHIKIKAEISDLEIRKYERFTQLMDLKLEFRKIEQEIITRFGRDSVVDLSTGEIKKREEVEDGKPE